MTSSQLPERGTAKRKSQGSRPEQTDTCEEGSPQEKPQEPDGRHPEACVQGAPPDAELSPCSRSPATAALQQCPESDSPQLEPVEAEGGSFPDASAAAKQLHSSPAHSFGQEDAGTPARSPGEEASLGTGCEQEETAQGAGVVLGSPTWEPPAGELGEAADTAPRVDAEGGSAEPQDARSQPPEDAPAPAGDPPAEGSETWAGSAHAHGSSGPRGLDCRPGERAHPATVFTLDIYLSKTAAAPVDEPAVVTSGEEDCREQADMEKRAAGRRSGKRRKSPRSSDSPGADTALPDSAARGGEVFHYEVTPSAAPERASAEKKVKSPRAAPDGGVAAAASPEPKSSPGPRGQAREESDRSKQPPPASSPTKRRSKSRVTEAVPTPPAAGPRAPAKESPPKRAPAPDFGPAAHGAAAENGEEAARVIPRELTVKSSSLLPDIKPEHKRGPLPNHFDGRGEGSRSKELGRSPGGPDADCLKPRNHCGVGRSTVTTKVTL